MNVPEKNSKFSFIRSDKDFLVLFFDTHTSFDTCSMSKCCNREVVTTQVVETPLVMIGGMKLCMLDIFSGNLGNGPTKKDQLILETH